MDTEGRSLSALVKEMRRQLSLSQEDLARLLGVTYPTINRWENGRAKPSPLALKQIEDLARGLGERGKDLLQEFFPGEES
jgi:DNA-binding transcriptional regulator YiaG